MSLLKNEERLKKYLDSRTKQAEKLLRSTYQDVLKNVKSEIAWVYEKYAVEGVVSYSDMAKYRRLQILQGELDKILGGNTKTVNKELDKFVETQYKTTFKGEEWAFRNGLEIGVSFGGIPQKTIDAVLNNPFSLIAKDSLSEAQRIRLRRTLIEGFTQGQSYQQMARNVSDTMQRTYNDALRIARTEGGRAESEAQADAYEAATEEGIDGAPVWVSAFLEKSRPEHMALDGQRAERIDGQWLFRVQTDAGQRLIEAPRMSGVASFDINCVCSTRFEVESIPAKLRRSKKTGNIISFEEFKKEME